ncbi:hypothetical protein QTP88_019661 [Uroleucon formosanum]
MEQATEEIETPENFVGIQKKEIIVNFYKNLMLEQQNLEASQKLKYKDLIKKISITSGVGQKTVERTLAEYKAKGETSTKSWVDTTISSPRDAFLRRLTTGQKEPSGKGKRLIVLHIGSSDGFVPGGLLCFESKKNTSDYHDEMNGDTFYDWFIKILPSLKENAVIVMDNASYHSVKKNRFPTMAWNKQEIKDWLENEGHITQPELLKSQLLELANQFKPLDEIAKENNKIVLRLPPYHCELNPIELAWSWIKHYVRMYNTTFKLQDVHNLLKDAVEHVTSEMWTNFIGHVIKEEDKFLRVDHLSDEVFDAETGEHTLTVTGDTT